MDLFMTPGFYGVIAVDGTEVIGFAMGHLETWDRGKHFYLQEMCVAPARQRGGIGTTIIQTICDDLAAMHVEKIYLLTSRDTPAADFYEKCGFYVSQKMVMMGK